jgi:glutathione S-transferase
MDGDRSRTVLTEWLTLAEAVRTPGVRLVLARFGAPSPWSELCRGMYEAKGIEYRRVDGRDPDGAYHALRALSGQESVPVLLLGHEPPRAGWLEQLYVAERLSAATPLLPELPHSRALVVGLVAELAGEGGFGWCRRLQMIERLAAPGAHPAEQQLGLYLRHKYGACQVCDPASRCREIVVHLADRLRRQEDAGRPFLLGQRVSALDLAWAAFAALIEPLPDALCPMSSRWRELYRWSPPEVPAADVERLLAHRDRIYRQHFALPIPTR